jgi:hypothetical protein
MFEATNLDNIILAGLAAWLGLSALVALWAGKRGYGSRKGFALALALTPVVAAIGIAMWEPAPLPGRHVG